MTFSTITFLLVFIPAVLLCYFLCPARWTGVRNGVLLIASVFFYAWGEPVNVVLILLCVGGTWLLSFQVEKHRKGALLLAAAVNLLPLFLYKYADFFIENLNLVPGVRIPALGLVLPAGISFYTFQVITYIVDLYAGKVERQRNPAYLALYVFFFPQLIAGPIVRYADVEKEIRNRTSTWAGCREGAGRFIIGLAKKMLIANQAGMVVTAIQAQPEAQNGVWLLWVSVISYGIQILFDFSGYSDMAIGLGRIFGFHFRENFDRPYLSCSVTEFWRRWHISLSTFFRDYVYIPLGGNRAGRGRHIFNLFAVWALTGLWHGAFWNYVLWGIYYFVLLAGEKFCYGRYLEKLPYLLRRGITFFAYMFGWAIFMFESNSIPEIGHRLLRLFGAFPAGAGVGLRQLEVQGSFCIVLLGLLIAMLPAPGKLTALFRPAFAGWEAPVPGRPGTVLMALADLLLLALLVVCVLVIVSESFNPFIYFRF